MDLNQPTIDYRRRREEQLKKEKERKMKIATGAKFEAKKVSRGGQVFAAIVMTFFAGMVGALATLGASLILAIIAVPIIIIYYYGIAQSKSKKRHAHEKFYCPYCRNIFQGMLDKCPHCGNKIKVDLFKCENCSNEIAGRKETCPRCGVGLYYK